MHRSAASQAMAFYAVMAEASVNKVIYSHENIWINETKFLSSSKYLARHQSYIYFFHLNNSFFSLTSHNISTPFIYFLSFSYSNIPSQHTSSLAGRFNLAIKLSVFLVPNPYPFPIIWNNKFIFFIDFLALMHCLEPPEQHWGKLISADILPVLDLRIKAFSLSPLSMVLTVGILWMPFYHSDKVPFYFMSAENFRCECGILSHVSSASIETLICFLFLSVNIMNYTDF